MNILLTSSVRKRSSVLMNYRSIFTKENNSTFFLLLSLVSVKYLSTNIASFFYSHICGGGLHLAEVNMSAE